MYVCVLCVYVCVCCVCTYVCVVCVQCYIPVTRLSPSGPLQSLLTFGVNVFPSNDTHKYVDLPDKVSFTFCVCCMHCVIHRGVRVV